MMKDVIKLDKLNILFIPITTLFGLSLWLIMAIVGWILIPIHAALKRYKTVTSGFDNTRQILVFKDWYMYPWSSDEDGIDWVAHPNDWHESRFIRIIRWSCMRNAVGNHRFVWPLSLKIESERVGYIASKGFKREWSNDRTKDFWYIAWQGFRGCIRIHYKSWRIWLGWKIYPSDIDDIQPLWRQSGVGIAKQFKKMRDYHAR